MFVLGLGHRARHGKDSVARAIVQYCASKGIYAKQYAFADALKSHCRVAFGMREKDAPLLQMVGTNLYRRQDPGIWVRVLMDTLVEQQPDVAVITDMRFPNEAAAVKAAGGKTMRVSRYTKDGQLWVSGDRDPNHESEIALNDYPFDVGISAFDGDQAELIERGVTVFRYLFKEAA